MQVDGFPIYANRGSTARHTLKIGSSYNLPTFTPAANQVRFKQVISLIDLVPLNWIGSLDQKLRCWLKTEPASAAGTAPTDASR